MKPGYQTSEFWITIATLIAGAFVPDLPKELIITSATYVAGRVAQKSVTANAKAKEAQAGSTSTVINRTEVN